MNQPDIKFIKSTLMLLKSTLPNPLSERDSLFAYLMGRQPFLSLAYIPSGGLIPKKSCASVKVKNILQRFHLIFDDSSLQFLTFLVFNVL